MYSLRVSIVESTKIEDYLTKIFMCAFESNLHNRYKTYLANAVFDVLQWAIFYQSSKMGTLGIFSERLKKIGWLIYEFKYQ